jgi:hypothetical protein
MKKHLTIETPEQVYTFPSSYDVWRVYSILNNQITDEQKRNQLPVEGCRITGNGENPGIVYKVGEE